MCYEKGSSTEFAGKEVISSAHRPLLDSSGPFGLAGNTGDVVLWAGIGVVRWIVVGQIIDQSKEVRRANETVAVVVAVRPGSDMLAGSVQTI